MMLNKMINIVAQNLWRLFHRGLLLETPTVPMEESTIVLVNHQSMSEPTMVYATLAKIFKRPVAFFCMDKVFSWPIIGYVIKHLNFIPVERGTANASQSLDKANHYLSTIPGAVLGIYPEGNISKGRASMAPQSLKTGAARLIVQNPNTSVRILVQNGSTPGKRKIVRNLITHPLITMKLSDSLIIDKKYYEGGLDSENIKELTFFLENEMHNFYEKTFG